MRQTTNATLLQQLLVTPDDAAEEWWVLDSSNEKSENDPGEVTRHLSLLGESDNWRVRGASVKLLPRTRGTSVSEGESEESDGYHQGYPEVRCECCNRGMW